MPIVLPTTMASDILAIVRRITRSPTQNLLTDQQGYNYINYAIQYDVPEEIKMMPLRQTLTFYTQPFIDTYSTSADMKSPLFEFKDRIINVHEPVFFAGIQGIYYQDRALFFGAWPLTNYVIDTLQSGNGVTTSFTGNTTSFPMLQNNVQLASVDANGNNLLLIDYPQPNNSYIGLLGPVGMPQVGVSPYGTINYVTGAYTANFIAPLTAPAAAQPIYLTVITYQPAKPFSMLFYENVFTIRPVPDKMYVINFDVDVMPTAFTDQTNNPDIKQWFYYYALLASRRIFIERMDTNSLQQLQPILDHWQDLAFRPTLQHWANKRTSTVFTRGRYYGFGGVWPNAYWPY